MPAYIVNLHVEKSYEYEIEAENEDEALEKARGVYLNQSNEDREKQYYSFAWLEPDVYPVKVDVPDYLSNPIFGRE